MEKKGEKLTSASYKKYSEELDHYRNVKVMEIAEQIKEARAFGDISENAEYDLATAEQARIVAHIEELEELLKYAEVIDEKKVDTRSVNVGTAVVLEDTDTHEIERYSVVGSAEVSPLENKISPESPVGRALMGHKAGDIVEINVPIGVIHLQVKEIKKL